MEPPANAKPKRRKKASNSQTPVTKRRAAPKASEPQHVSELTPEPPAQILVRLVRDAVFSRIRHRAMLHVLAEGGFDAKAYHRTFCDLVRRDYRAMYSKLILSQSDFQSLHGDWAESDELFYRRFFGVEPDTIDQKNED
jgi:hypothetical protein